MRLLKSFAMFWYDFIIGDDWTVAVGVVVALAATGALTHAQVNAWWLLPVAAAGLLMVSVLRVARRGRARRVPR
ncbi:MAG: hypothetical protein QOE51_4581 [Actinoplanes sp.]|jgi:hypothetical protein|nr:hypothetical protein [Actinoplanes sp.]